MSIVIPHLLICSTQVLQGRLWVCWRRLGPGFHFLCFFGFAIFVGINSAAQGIELGEQGICFLNVVFLVFGVHMRLHIVQNYFSKQQHEYNV